MILRARIRCEACGDETLIAAVYTDAKLDSDLVSQTAPWRCVSCAGQLVVRFDEEARQ